MMPPERLIDCPERDRLRTLCTHSMQTYANVIFRWHEGWSGTGTPKRHEADLARKNSAHARFDEALHALVNHENFHHC